MKQLGEIVSALRTANGWTLDELASLVRRAGAKNVKHQHLQQLESKPHTRPRYIIELAAAFGKSVEELRAWHPNMPQYGHHDQSAHGVRDASPSYNLTDHLSKEELTMLTDYRSCTDEVQAAMRVMLHASRKSRQHRSNGYPA